MRNFNIFVLATLLACGGLRAQDAVRANMNHILLDQNHKVVGQPITLSQGAYLRLTPTTGPDVYVRLTDDLANWQRHPLYFTTTDCTGTPYHLATTSPPTWSPVNNGRPGIVNRKAGPPTRDWFLWAVTEPGQLNLNIVRKWDFLTCVEDIQTGVAGDPLEEIGDLGAIWEGPFSFGFPTPPNTPSFADVPPEHQFFKAIEALKNSRVTQGCAVGWYCPDAFVTRAEMAAFLTRALGLVPVP